MGEPAGEVASEDRTALHGMGERLFQLVSKGAAAARWREWLRTPLEHALAEGDKELALGLLKAGVDGGAGWEGRDGRTLLGAAAEGGNAELVSAILEAGGLKELDVVSGDNKMTALHHAIAGGHIDAARGLVLDGADVKIADSRQRSALHYALDGGHIELARDIVIAGADVRAKDGDGNTPLHLAAARGWTELSLTLLRRRAGVSATNAEGRQPLHEAVENDHTDTAEALLKAGADPSVRCRANKFRSPLFLACFNAEMTRVLLRFGADVEDRDPLGRTALHWAGERGDPDVVHALIEAGADLETRCLIVYYYEIWLQFEGLTPLHCAAICENIGTMAVLLCKGANINAKDAEGLTPLHVACKVSAGQRSRVHAVDFLLRNGADETVTDAEGRAAVDLIESGADPSGGLRRLLTNAPADRAWRRRGTLVLCRARSDEVKSAVKDGRAGKAPCQGNGVAGGTSAAAGGGGVKADGDVLVRVVVELEIEAIFRKIVGFL